MRARLSRPLPLKLTSRRTLDFDIETIAAGYADPAWVPDTVTAWACSWVDEETIFCGLLPVHSFYDREAQRGFLAPLLEMIGEADVVTGHNIIRFDLRVLSAQVMKLGLPNMPTLKVQDTIRLPKSKGFKKGQDNLAMNLGITEDKLPLNWEQWEAAYAEPGMETVRDRVVRDVRQHKLLRLAMRERGWLESPRVWQPKP